MMKVKLNQQIALPGFTLAELLTAVVVFTAITIMAVSVYINVFGANRKANADRIVIDETTFLMEKIVKDIRNGTVDYPGYYRWKRQSGDYQYPPDSTTIKSDYVSYTEQTPGYIAPTSGDIPETSSLTGYEDCSVETCTPPGSPVTEAYPGLMILSADGSTRTIFKLNDDSTLVNHGEIIMNHERLIEAAADSKWYWIDGDAIDSNVSTVATDCDFNDPANDAADCAVVDNVISSERIDITDFSFIISPGRDPFLAYDDITVQRQPMVRITISAEPAADFPAGPGTRNPIQLTTTISIRSYGEVAWSPYEEL